MGQFAVTFERAQDDTVVDHLESFISQLLTTERENAKEEGYKLAESDHKGDYNVKYNLGLEKGRSQAYAKVREVIESEKKDYIKYIGENASIVPVLKNLLTLIERLAKE